MKKIFLIKRKISDALDCSTAIITQEQRCDQPAHDRMCNSVLEWLEVKGKENIAIFMLACILYSSVIDGFILTSGRITNKSVCKSEI